MMFLFVYYKPRSGALPRTQYGWIPYLFFSPIYRSHHYWGDVNACNTFSGYSSTNRRCRLLEQTLECSTLKLANEYSVATRIGLYYAQSSTTPVLTLATPGAVKSWHTMGSTCGSDHYPIMLQINSQNLRSKRPCRHITWTSYRSEFAISSQPTLEEFIASLTQARLLATDEEISTAEVNSLDSSMFQLLRKAERLTK